MSCDDKNEVLTGVPAVSRYHQLRRMFPKEDAPDFDQHDFPDGKSKLIPLGYMFMQKKITRHRSVTRMLRIPFQTRRTRSYSSPRLTRESDSSTVDNKGRKHIRIARTGPLHIVNRSEKFVKQSAVNHAKDFYNIVAPEVKKSGKRSVLLVTDKGSDYSPKSTVQFLNMGRLWRDLKTELLKTDYVCCWAFSL